MILRLSTLEKLASEKKMELTSVEAFKDLPSGEHIVSSFVLDKHCFKAEDFPFAGDFFKHVGRLSKPKTDQTRIRPGVYI